MTAPGWKKASYPTRDIRDRRGSGDRQRRHTSWRGGKGSGESVHGRTRGEGHATSGQIRGQPQSLRERPRIRQPDRFLMSSISVQAASSRRDAGAPRPGGG